MGRASWLTHWKANKMGPRFSTDISQRQFVIVLDAGSTGSRLHVYRFKMQDNQVDSVEDELFAEVKPGLSDYANNPRLAAKSLVPLLEKAKLAVPKALYTCTPIVLKATAGLRLLSDAESKAILQSVKSVIQKTPFSKGPIVKVATNDSEDDAVSIMDGAEEGLLAWMTVMFLQKQSTTPIVLELGGGSAQIVFQVDFLPKEKALWKTFYSKEFVAGKDHILYRNSYLGYGLMEARKHLLSKHVVSESGIISHNCLPHGSKVSIKTSASEQTTIHGSSTGWEACQESIRQVLFPQSNCTFDSGCSFNGIHQPIIQGSESVIAFSYFNDKLGPLNLTKHFTTDDIKKAGKFVCSNKPPNHPIVEQDPFYCLDVAYIYSLLVHGYNLRPSNTISCLKKIDGFEAGWALGSALQVLGKSQLDMCLLSPSSSSS